MRCLPYPYTRRSRPIFLFYSIVKKADCESETMTYNGNEQGVKLKIEGALSESDFDIEYYDRGFPT